MNHTEPSGHCCGYPSVLDWNGLQKTIEERGGNRFNKYNITPVDVDCSETPGGWIHYIIKEDSDYCLYANRHRAMSCASNNDGGDGSSITGYKNCPEGILSAIISSGLNTKSNSILDQYEDCYEWGCYMVYRFSKTMHDSYIRLSDYYVMTKSQWEWNSYLDNKYSIRDYIESKTGFIGDALGGGVDGPLAYIGFTASIINLYLQKFAPNEVRYFSKLYKRSANPDKSTSFSLAYRVVNYDKFGGKRYIFFGPFEWKTYYNNKHNAF